MSDQAHSDRSASPVDRVELGPEYHCLDVSAAAFSPRFLREIADRHRQSRFPEMEVNAGVLMWLIDRSTELLDVIEALDWTKAPTTDDALAGIERRLGDPPTGYKPSGRVRALFSRERIEANRQRGRADRAEAATKKGLRAIRAECTSGSAEMHEVDAQWIELFGRSPDAPWLSYPQEEEH